MGMKGKRRGPEGRQGKGSKRKEVWGGEFRGRVNGSSKVRRSDGRSTYVE